MQDQGIMDRRKETHTGTATDLPDDFPGHDLVLAKSKFDPLTRFRRGLRKFHHAAAGGQVIEKDRIPAVLPQAVDLLFDDMPIPLSRVHSSCPRWMTTGSLHKCA